MKPYVEGVPSGHYCYGYVPAPDSGFSSMAELDAYLQKQHDKGDESINEHIRLMVPKYCKYWNSTEHGFVECKHLNRKALWITTTDDVVQKAIAYFGSEEKMDKNIEGFLLGDAVKECNLNRDGPDFAIGENAEKYDEPNT